MYPRYAAWRTDGHRKFNIYVSYLVPTFFLFLFYFTSLFIRSKLLSFIYTLFIPFYLYFSSIFIHFYCYLFFCHPLLFVSFTFLGTFSPSRITYYFRHIRKSVRLSICSHVRAWLQLHGFPWNLISGTLMKICRETPNFFKIRQKYLALYIKNLLRFIVASEINFP
jgi:hypothetical protein